MKTLLYFFFALICLNLIKPNQAFSADEALVRRWTAPTKENYDIPGEIIISILNPDTKPILIEFFYYSQGRYINFLQTEDFNHQFIKSSETHLYKMKLDIDKSNSYYSVFKTIPLEIICGTTKNLPFIYLNTGKVSKPDGRQLDKIVMLSATTTEYSALNFKPLNILHELNVTKPAANECDELLSKPIGSN